MSIKKIASAFVDLLVFFLEFNPSRLFKQQLYEYSREKRSREMRKKCKHIEQIHVVSKTRVGNIETVKWSDGFVEILHHL
jgi:hypothetical protein